MKKQIWALQVTDTYIMAVLVAKRAVSYEILKSNYYALEEGVLAAGKILNKAKFLEKLKVARKENKIRGAVALTISESLVLTKGMETPPLKKKEFEQYVKEEFSNFAVYTKKDFFFDYREFSLTKDKKFDYVVSIAKETCLEYLKIFKQAGMKIAFITAATESLFEALPFITEATDLAALQAKAPYALVIISDEVTKVSIFDSTNMVGHNSVDMGLNTIDKEGVDSFMTRLSSIFAWARNGQEEVAAILVVLERERPEALLEKLAAATNKKVYYAKKNNSFAIIIALSSAVNLLENKKTINILKRHYENKLSATNRAISLALVFFLFNAMFVATLTPTWRGIKNLKLLTTKANTNIATEKGLLTTLTAEAKTLASVTIDNTYFESIKALKTKSFDDLKIATLYGAIPPGVTVNRFLISEKILAFEGVTTDYAKIATTLAALLKKPLISDGKIVSIGRVSANAFLFKINFSLK